MLEPGEVRINADIKDGGMMLITALSPYANWLQGYADVLLQVDHSFLITIIQLVTIFKHKYCIYILVLLLFL